MFNNNQPLFDVKAVSNSNVHATTCVSSRNVLSKTSDDVTIKSYFEGVDYTTQVPDNQVFHIYAENPLGGRPSVSYYLTVS